MVHTRGNTELGDLPKGGGSEGSARLQAEFCEQGLAFLEGSAAFQQTAGEYGLQLDLSPGSILTLSACCRVIECILLSTVSISHLIGVR